MVPLQPSLTKPHSKSWSVQACCMVYSVQLDCPHLLAIPPPPQLLGAMHVPQSKAPPQPSLT